MDRNKIKDLQAAQLDILMYVQDVCKRLGITYFLMFGTLLGAIRHNGPIPWDADIDIAMFREDYETLKRYMTEHGDQRYFYSDYSTYKHHIAPHAVLIDKNSHLEFSEAVKKKYAPAYDGVYIDIFPIDRTSPDRELQLKQARSLMSVRQIISYKMAKIYEGKTNAAKKTAKQIVSGLLKPFTLRFLGGCINKIQRRYDNCDSDYYVIPTDNTCFDRIVSIDYYFPPRYVSFSGKEVCIPAKTEEILKQRYGDYMELPPEDERWDYLDHTISDVKFDA